MSNVFNESKMSNAEPREFLRPHEVAHRLCISQEQVRRHLRNKVLPGFKLGNVWLVRASELNRYISLKEALFDCHDNDIKSVC